MRVISGLILMLFISSAQIYTAYASEKIELLDVDQLEVAEVFKILSKRGSLNIMLSPNIKGQISLYLTDVTPEFVLEKIVENNQWAYVQEDNFINVCTREEFKKRYGYEFKEEYVERKFKILFADVSDALKVVNQLKSPSAHVVGDEVSQTILVKDKQKNVESMAAMINDMDVPLVTQVFTMDYVQLEEIKSEIEPLLTQAKGMVKANRATNTLIVTDQRRVVRRIAKMIEAFDQRHKEVLIEAKIIQVSLSDDFKLGINWDVLIKDAHQLSLKSNFDVLSPSQKAGRIAIGSLENDDYQATIEALKTVGRTNLLSSPRITALNNEEAKILVGSSQPYVSTTTTTPSSGPATTAEQINFIEVGVKLYATPRIHNDGFITMKIKPEVSSVVSTIVTANNNTIPVVETSEVETKVLVKDGASIVIGGLIKEDRISTERQVPVLSQVPVLGHAFKNNSDVLSKSEIVVFLKPTIITGNGQASSEKLTLKH